MEKNELKKVIKEKGLEGVEDLVEKTIEEMYEFIEVVIKASKNSIASSVLPLIMMTKPIVLGFVDKIDGKEG